MRHIDRTQGRARRCFECAMEMPPGATRCAHCGWLINKREQAFWVTFALIALGLVGIVALMVYLSWGGT